MTDLKTFVETRLKELRLGPIEAAVQGGIERTYIRDILKGNKQSVRADKMEGLARALKVSEQALSLAIRAKKREANKELRTVMVAAHVQAGLFAESWEWAEEDQYPVAVPSLPVLEGFRLYAAETRGPSMNRRWPEGTVVVFTNAQETKEEPIPGKRYVVECKKLGGEAEHTVKLLHQDSDGKFWLVPESHDPLFQTPISVEEGGDDDEEIIIVGRVWFAVSRE